MSATWKKKQKKKASILANSIDRENLLVLPEKFAVFSVCDAWNLRNGFYFLHDGFEGDG